MSLKKLLNNKIFLSLILFFLVFIILSLSVDQIWFKLDDLGSIIKGYINSIKSFFRVFSTDCRDYITPENYKFSKPNFISALYRPLQSVFFSVVYYLFGLKAYYFYLLNIFFHSLDTVLIFFLFTNFLTINLSFLGALLFAFYRNVSWLTWLSVLQNPLSLFFIFITIILYKNYLIKKSRINLYLSGVTFLLSLLAREDTIGFAFCILIFNFLFLDNNKNNWEKTKISINKSFIFFITIFLYFLIRIWAFGFGTLDRTINNLFLRFNFLNNLFYKKVIVSSNIKFANAINNTNVYNKILPEIKLSFIFSWGSSFFNTSDNFLIIILFIFFTFFLIYSYKNNLKILFFLFISFLLFAWPGILAYPDVRYINVVYPVIIFMFLLGIRFCLENKKFIINKIFILISYFIIILSILYGLNKNISSLKSSALYTLEYKKMFEPFFQENKFNQNNNFIVLGTPFVSDIQYVFQYFLNNFKLKLCCELFSTYAQKGNMGCQKDYKVKGVKSKWEKVIINNKTGYRFISLDKENCALWMTFSMHPQKWSEEEKAYIWTDKIPELKTWIDFSMGKFFINERLEDKYITDIIFIIDNNWIDKDTVIVSWDSYLGKYYILDKFS